MQSFINEEYLFTEWEDSKTIGKNKTNSKFFDQLEYISSNNNRSMSPFQESIHNNLYGILQTYKDKIISTLRAYRDLRW